MSSVSTTAVLLADADVGVAAPRDSAGEMRAKPARQLSHVYFDTSGAAERLGVSPRTLVDYRSRGGGPKWVRIARAVRYRADWLDQWAEDNAVTSTSQETAKARR
jgi:Helix-turn-helix domain